MPFKPGQSGNPNGRGHSVNKHTIAVKQALAKIWNDNIPQLKLDLMQMTPWERQRTLTALLPYFLPQLAKVQSELSTTEQPKEIFRVGAIEVNLGEEIGFEEMDGRELEQIEGFKRSLALAVKANSTKSQE